MQEKKDLAVSRQSGRPVFLKSAQNWQQGFTQHTREKIRAAQERKDQTKDKETRLVPPQL